MNSTGKYFYREVMDDFDLARRTFPAENALDLIGDAFQLSEDDVIYDPLMFPSQMIDRLGNEKVIRLTLHSKVNDHGDGILFHRVAASQWLGHLFRD
jgi:hypothetical protein